MASYIPFLQMFSQYSPQEPLAGLLSQAVIRNAELDMEARAILLELDCPRYIPLRLLEGVCRELRQVYDVRRVELLPHFPPEQLTQVEPEELMQLFVEQDSRSRGSLAGSRWEWEGTS